MFCPTCHTRMQLCDDYNLVCPQCHPEIVEMFESPHELVVYGNQEIKQEKNDHPSPGIAGKMAVEDKGL